MQISLGSTSAEQKQFPQLRSKNKEMKKRVGAPRGAQSAYHIFLKIECERLKSTDSGKVKGQNIRYMVDNAWRSLSASEKQVELHLDFFLCCLDIAYSNLYMVYNYV